MSEIPRRERMVDLPRSRADIGRDQIDEIEAHIAQRAGELAAGGLSADAARAQAEREFGNVAEAAVRLAHADEQVYRTRRRRLWLSDLRFDLRYALRGLRRSPGFSLVVVTTLVLAIGATTAIFSVFSAYLLRPLPFPASDRLVLVNDVQPNYGDAPAAYEEFVDWSALDAPFDAVAAFMRRNRNYAGAEYPERIRVGLVSERFFDLIAAHVIAGRLFTPAEHQQGAPAAVVVTESFWRTRLGGDERMLGSSIRLDGESMTLIGVVADPPHLRTGDPLLAFQPLEATTAWRDRGTHYLTVWGRLQRGVTLDQANERLRLVSASLQETRNTDHAIAVVALRDLFVGEARPLFVVTLVTVVLVLIIALANVANLMLARAAGRAQEFALRAALGAGRLRISRQLLVEALVLATLGGVLGLLVGSAGAPVLLAGLPDSIPRPPLVAFDPRVLSLVAVITLGATLLFGMTPLFAEWRGTIATTLRSGRGESAPAHAGRTRQSLVVLQLALSLALLAAASLMVRSFTRLMVVDSGVRTDGVITFQLNLPSNAYDTAERRAQFFAELEARLARMPQVAAVGAAANLPLAGGGMNGDFRLEGAAEDAVLSQPLAEKRIVTPGYFSALGVELVRGRLFTRHDRAGAPNVVLINETMARTMWPQQDPIGRRIRSLSGAGEWEEIVGIVRDVRASGLDRVPPLEILYPYAQHVSSGMVVIVRGRAEVEALVRQLRAEVAAVDPQQPIYNVRTMDDIVSQTVAGKRLLLLLSGALGLLALLLAAIGTAGISAYSVARRTREIGVRVALGARPGAVLTLIMTEAFTLAVIGVLIGMIGAVIMGETLRSQLFETAPTDGMAHLAAVLTLLATASAAAYLPARRALRVDPLRAIRSE